ncbi:hypothetical protein HMPREF0262_03487 [Clostridium sp. ATCC 29733]|nr:hypothetical protein HMPREF0262_03487 [Clostridium sp. ATCC 29733]
MFHQLSHKKALPLPGLSIRPGPYIEVVYPPFCPRAIGRGRLCKPPRRGIMGKTPWEGIG